MLLSEELNWRGFNGYTTLDDITELDKKKFNFYWGVDPSSDSMTIGNLAAAMMIRHFIEHGHKAYLLVGGATGLIGDPDGKASERNIKTREEIENNKNKIKNQYDKLFNSKPITVVDNYDWFKDFNYLDFLRDVGKHVPLSSMLARDFVKNRLGPEGTGISYAEFSYSLIQGYDFLHLYKNEGVSLQLSGVDQVGNVIAGIDLIRRKESVEANVFAMPLIINKSTGAKFGKTEEGAIWLDEKKTSVYKFYQFWLNEDDNSVIDHLKIYTMLDKNTIENISNEHKNNPEARKAQKVLADEVTTLVHGKERAEAAKRVTAVLFGNEAFDSLSNEDKEMLASEIPAVGKGKTLIEALIESSQVSSNGEARRLIESGGVSINGEKISSDLNLDQSCLIKKGKNTFIVVR